MNLHSKQFNRLQILKDWNAPILYDMHDSTDKKKVDELLSSGTIKYAADQIEVAIQELYDIDYPAEKDLELNQKTQFRVFRENFLQTSAIYAYLPWNGLLIRIPDKISLRKLRTSRNRNLIRALEQEKLYNATILVAGLSVGSNIVEALVSMGIGGKFVLADMDVIEPSNLNRIRAPYHHVGLFKTDSTAMRMGEIDPYLEFALYREGITESSFQEIMSIHKPDILIDEMDQLPLKIHMRKQAKKHNIPLLSAADDGDSTIIDIERYDTDKDYPLFHGLVERDVLEKIQSGKGINRQELGIAIGKYFIGSKNIPLRMFESLNEVGKTLPSWPQLGSAAAQSGIAVAFASYKILTDQPLRSGKHVIGPEQVLDPNLEDEAYVRELKQYQNRLDSFNL
jgi:molybdopterin/thiamine biosynthesis adenylyltransferase